MEYVENFNLIGEMVGNALGVNVIYDEPEDFDGEELSNEEAERFYQLLNEMNMSLFEGSSDAKLSMCETYWPLSQIGMFLIDVWNSSKK